MSAHDTGTYYTPREIVHFMCRQALDGYLREQTGVDDETIDWLRREAVDPLDVEGEDRTLDSEMATGLVNALEAVRVCDPAVGSGAFLLGTMQEIVRLRQGIEHAQGQYLDEGGARSADWKRHAIQWNLYGVDINPAAVEICQLRLWLSLVLDMPNPREVEPLPNLDFRIVAGDSLIDRVAGITFAQSLPPGAYQPPLELAHKLDKEEADIDRWRREFDGTEGAKQLTDLRKKIRIAYTRIVRHHLDAELAVARDGAATATDTRKTKKKKKAVARVADLEELRDNLSEDAPYQKPFLWPVAFLDVFKNGGFDIVLANPPYIRQERLAPADQAAYKESFPEVYAGTADALVFFYARALQILKEEGRLAFITSNKFMRAAYGERLRNHLPASMRIERVLDFGDLPVFDVAAYPAVLIGQHDSRGGENNLRVASLVPSRPPGASGQWQPSQHRIGA